MTTNWTKTMHVCLLPWVWSRLAMDQVYFTTGKEARSLWISVESLPLACRNLTTAHIFDFDYFWREVTRIPFIGEQANVALILQFKIVTWKSYGFTIYRLKSVEKDLLRQFSSISGKTLVQYSQCFDNMQHVENMSLLLFTRSLKIKWFCACI